MLYVILNRERPIGAIAAIHRGGRACPNESYPLLLGLVATFVVGWVVPASAITYEWDTAARGTAPVPSEMHCRSNDYAKVCYQTYGDQFWVRDDNSDGQSAVADWRNYSGDTGALRRKGGCRNALGSGKWARCNKNFADRHDLPPPLPGQLGCR